MFKKKKFKPLIGCREKFENMYTKYTLEVQKPEDNMYFYLTS